MPVEEELLTKEDTVRLKRRLYALQRDDLPPVTTHNVVNDWSDPVLNTIRRCKLFNTTSDKVKVRRYDVGGRVYTPNRRTPSEQNNVVGKKSTLPIL